MTNILVDRSVSGGEPDFVDIDAFWLTGCIQNSCGDVVRFHHAFPVEVLIHLLAQSLLRDRVGNIGSGRSGVDDSDAHRSEERRVGKEWRAGGGAWRVRQGGARKR